ncbi:hypothetical protein BDR26DRAFT_981060 [Obelidium mucronatum]|nr:hypothetical protein BDR26DRAFT_981060 [Obelidium mucronatum]
MIPNKATRTTRATREPSLPSSVVQPLLLPFSRADFAAAVVELLGFNADKALLPGIASTKHEKWPVNGKSTAVNGAVKSLASMVRSLHECGAVSGAVAVMEAKGAEYKSRAVLAIINGVRRMNTCNPSSIRFANGPLPIPLFFAKGLLQFTKCLSDIDAVSQLVPAALITLVDDVDEARLEQLQALELFFLCGSPKEEYIGLEQRRSNLAHCIVESLRDETSAVIWPTTIATPSNLHPKYCSVNEMVVDGRQPTLQYLLNGHSQERLKPDTAIEATVANTAYNHEFSPHPSGVNTPSPQNSLGCTLQPPAIIKVAHIQVPPRPKISQPAAGPNSPASLVASAFASVCLSSPIPPPAETTPDESFLSQLSEAISNPPYDEDFGYREQGFPQLLSRQEAPHPKDHPHFTQSSAVLENSHFTLDCSLRGSVSDDLILQVPIVDENVSLAGARESLELFVNSAFNGHNVKSVYFKLYHYSVPGTVSFSVHQSEGFSLIAVLEPVAQYALLTKQAFILSRNINSLYRPPPPVDALVTQYRGVEPLIVVPAARSSQKTNSAILEYSRAFISCWEHKNMTSYAACSVEVGNSHPGFPKTEKMFQFSVAITHIDSQLSRIVSMASYTGIRGICDEPYSTDALIGVVQDGLRLIDPISAPGVYCNGRLELDLLVSSKKLPWFWIFPVELVGSRSPGNGYDE